MNGRLSQGAATERIGKRLYQIWVVPPPRREGSRIPCSLYSRPGTTRTARPVQTMFWPRLPGRVAGRNAWNPNRHGMVPGASRLWHTEPIAHHPRPAKPFSPARPMQRPSGWASVQTEFAIGVGPYWVPISASRIAANGTGWPNQCSKAKAP
jgi:hypothetical protein